MLRVLQTMNQTAQAELFTEHQIDLNNWITEILQASWKYQVIYLTKVNKSLVTELLIPRTRKGPFSMF